MSDFSSFLGTLSYSELLDCKIQLDNFIKAAKDSHKTTAASKDVTNYVTAPISFVDPNSVEYSAINVELDSLSLKKKSHNSACTTKWLTDTAQCYEWQRGDNSVAKKDPISFDSFPAIKGVLDRLNSDLKLNLNSCLVSCLQDGRSSIRLHNDNEDSLDHSQPIVVLTMGACRKVDFLGCYQRSHETPASSHSPSSGSVYSMLPGCQEWFKHRVLGDRNCREPRYSLSFRCMKVVSNPAASPSPVPSQSSASRPPPSNTVLPSLPSSADHQPSAIGTTPPGITPPDIQGSSCSDGFTNKSSQPSPRLKSDKQRTKRTTVVFGTSITTEVIGRRLGRKGRHVINMSESGATIPTINGMVEDFAHYDRDADLVDRVVLCFGTNDIKHARNGVDHLKNDVFRLIENIRQFFPGPIILVLSVLPMKNLYWYTATNFLRFNSILQDVCFKTNSYYVDCFNNFLADDRYDYNHQLFKDDYHLNRKGLGILCSILKNVINFDCYSSIVRCEYGYY